jgi:hypothetical protein
MSQTPLPQTLSALPSADAVEARRGDSLAAREQNPVRGPIGEPSVDDLAATGEFRARKRTPSTSNRPVSAFAPGQGMRGSDPPPTQRSPAQRPSSPPSPEELAFASALRAAGVAQELDETELARALHGARQGASSEHSTTASRRIDVLIAYYAAAHDPLASKRRQATDRWFLYAAADQLDASQLVSRLLDTVPELTGAELERVGGRAGTLVLRAGEDVCALEDEREDEFGQPTLSVCDLVRAINVLLERRSVRARLVGLLGDGAREAYLALPSVTAAIALSNADYLAAPDAEALLDLTGW